jgi:hypothetical protein
LYKSANTPDSKKTGSASKGNKKMLVRSNMDSEFVEVVPSPSISDNEEEKEKIKQIRMSYLRKASQYEEDSGKSNSFILFVTFHFKAKK